MYGILGNHDYNAGIRGSGITGRLSWIEELLLRSYDHNPCYLYDNHPDLNNAQAIVSVLEENGVTVLRNEYVELNLTGKHLMLVGIDDIWAGRAATPEIPETDAFTLYLVHEPAWRPEWEADLILSGHTHGGQYMIPLLNMIDRLKVIQIRGLFWKGDVPLFVTRGTGTSDQTYELRYLSPPEVVVINPEPGSIPNDLVHFTVSR